MVIGLTTYLEQAQTGVWDVPASFLPKVYFEAVNKAGGIAVLLPPQPVTPEIANRVLDGLDGLIITGGKDVNPQRYGQQPHPATDEPRHDRDAWEDALLAAAIERGLPFLGICRGAQVLNVALGGTLHQHLPEVVGSDRYNKGGGVFATNAVAVEGGRLATIVGDDGRREVLPPPGDRRARRGPRRHRALRRRHDPGGGTADRAVRDRGAVASRGGRRRGRAPLPGSRRRGEGVPPWGAPP